MSADRDVTRIVRSWLDEGVTVLPDRVLDAVLDQVPATSQRRATWWPARRTPTVNKFFGVAVAAAAIVVAAVVGYRLLISNPNVGPPVGTPEPSPTPVALSPRGPHPIPAGDVTVGAPFEVPLTVHVPDGWTSQGALNVADNAYFPRFRLGDVDQGTPIWVGFSLITDVYADPCQYRDGSVDPRPASIDDLAAALASMPGFTATPVDDVMVDGHPARRFDLATDLSPATDGCDDSTWLMLWDGSSGSRLNVPGGTKMQVTIVDVGGTPVVVYLEYWEFTEATEIADGEAIVDSLHFE